ncbi:c-type cytochrome [Primorskyibacter sp. S87]|uniref:c-type cytochrome n=1 Tax=Primorskyibacter sp. S87 TaxID=3415126 RepID=UPI003C7EAABF
MPRLFRLAGLTALAGGIVMVAAATWPIGHEANVVMAGDAQRGAYLARASGCIACHTDFAAGGPPLAGGPDLPTPFGTLFAPNLTTDPEHGIGDWDLSSFAKAVRQGISPDGEPYYPAFPYPFYANFSDQDVADLWAAFQTVPPVAQASRSNAMRFPFNQRWGLKFWRAAFLRTPATEPVKGKSSEWNRGRALVEGAAHCGACHTPRNLVGARKANARLMGNAAIPGEGKAPRIDPKGLRSRNWAKEDIAYALQTGVTVDGDAFGGPMGEVVLHGTQYLTELDRRAIATYLLDEESEN